jgi:hypothetical protein
MKAMILAAGRGERMRHGRGFGKHRLPPAKRPAPASAGSMAHKLELACR